MLPCPKLMIRATNSKKLNHKSNKNLPNLKMKNCSFYIMLCMLVCKLRIPLMSSGKQLRKLFWTRLPKMENHSLVIRTSTRSLMTRACV
jgi:hypothetical protein